MSWGRRYVDVVNRGVFSTTVSLLECVHIFIMLSIFRRSFIFPNKTYLTRLTCNKKDVMRLICYLKTQWVPDGSPTHSSTPVKLEVAHQFVPMGTSSKEFKLKQKQIKENRRQGGISAGPQSHILEGVTWDEAKQMQVVY